MLIQIELNKEYSIYLRGEMETQFLEIYDKYNLSKDASLLDITWFSVNDDDDKFYQ